MIIDLLKKNGPCLSSDLAASLVSHYGLSPEAARKRISRSGVEVRRLDHLPFPKKARFIYLKEQYASGLYWRCLFQAIQKSGGAYAHALAALLGRGGAIPLEQFKVVCGAPIAQKKHISAGVVLERMIAADVLVKVDISHLGQCVITKESYDVYKAEGDDIFLDVRARLAAESILIDSVKEWLKRLAFASFDKVKVRSGADDFPKVGTFGWDITAPSYIAGLTNWQGGSIKPGFIVCDVLLKNRVDLNTITPFLYKVSSTQSLRNLGRTMFIFVAHSYSKDAFAALRSAGVVPATSRSLFGKDVADGFKYLIKTFSEAIKGHLDLDKFNNVFETLGKLEGALGNMRGTFFEFLVAELIRKTSQTDSIAINKIFLTSKGKREVDVFVFKEGIVAQIIECKGMTPGAFVDDAEVDLWLIDRLVLVKEHLFKNIKWSDKWPKPKFELWTSGLLSEESLARIDKTRKANARKIEINVIGPDDIRSRLNECNDPELLKAFKHFIPYKKQNNFH